MVRVVAGPGLRVVRRRKGALTAAVEVSSSALVAASMPVSDPTSIFTNGVAGKRRAWQDEAWEMYRQVPELRYYVDWRSSSCSRVRLVASAIDPETGEPTGSVDEKDRAGQRFVDIVRGIAGGVLNQARLVERLCEVLSVPGEVWVAVLWRDNAVGELVQQWFAVSRKEIERGSRSNSVVIKLPDGSKHEFDGSRDGIFRVWDPDAEDASVPSSAVQACLDPLREIVRTSRKIANADDSRLINNGLLVIPQEASLPSADAPVAADKPGGDGSGPGVRRAVGSQLQHLLVRAAETASKDPSSMAALVPIVATAPGEQIKNIAHIPFGKDLTDTSIKTRNDAINRLAMGLRMSPEQLLGMATANHWSSFKIGDQDVQLHIAPMMELICQALYDNVLRSMLVDEGIDPDAYTLWYDPSKLTADPDLRDEAKAAFDGGAIKASTYVRLSGLPEDALYDLTSVEGAQEWARDVVQRDPTQFLTFLPLLDAKLQALDFPEPQPVLPAGNPGVGGDVVVSGGRPDREPPTEDVAPRERPVEVAALSGDVELAVVDLLVRRALELAGKRRVNTKDRAEYARLRGIRTHDRHRFMGPVSDTEVSALIKGYDDILDDEFAVSRGLDPERVRAEVRRIARRELTSAVVDGLVV